MRITYQGTEYVLAHTNVSVRQISCMDHVGSLSVTLTPCSTTPQLYKSTDNNGDTVFYITAVQGNSQVINWIKRLVPVNQLEGLIGYAL